MKGVVGLSEVSRENNELGRQESLPVPTGKKQRRSGRVCRGFHKSYRGFWFSCAGFDKSTDGFRFFHAGGSVGSVISFSSSAGIVSLKPLDRLPLTSSQCNVNFARVVPKVL